VVITKSTVPIGWAEEMRGLLRDQADPSATVHVVSNPEFLREGSAVKDFLYPDRVVLGGDDERAFDVIARLYRPILEQTFDGGDRSHQPGLIRTDLATAETIKYAANGFLATKIAYINEIARICDSAGADVETVAEAVGLDNRIERKFLGAGIGYGGSCFGKDLQALAHYGVDHALDLPILNSVNPSNVTQRLQVVQKVKRGLGGTLAGKRIALLGLAYKPNTDDVREAPSVTIARQLIAEGATPVAYDPVVKSLDALPDLEAAADPYDAVDGADAVVLITEWKEFAKLDFHMMSRLMRGDLVVDGRNWLSVERVVAAGLRYEAMGRRALRTD
jgi:nucleotide sugar dehydrogenase